jgi:beta-glucanase (GH16 family)
VPSVANGTYYVMLGVNDASGPIQLTPGPGVIHDNQYRYYIGAVTVQASAPAPTPLAPVTLNLTGYILTFDDEFTTLTISDSTAYNGANWYTQNEQCCMSTTDGSTTAMVGLSSPENPFSLKQGGGLDIRLQKVANNWTSGVLTSVANSGVGFSQQYGYFEMEAAFPSGLDTWPAFWMLNTAAINRSAPPGEIDIVEYIANPGFIDYIRTTLHDWSDDTTPAFSANAVTLPSDGNYHTYGMLWTAQTMTFYYDGTVTFQTPTPTIMHQPYYLLVDLGIGSGWPTNTTPPVNDMLIKHIRAYSLPGQ